MEKNYHIIITNQHCDNRGDQSATIGLIEQIYACFGQNTAITMLKQTKKYQFIPDEYSITEQDMQYSFFFMAQMLLWIMVKTLGIDIRRFLSRSFGEFLRLHEGADLILSSCGGPYIGDLYLNHEIIHLLYVLLPELLGKQVVFTAPSMGPFHNKLMNPLRKKALKRASLIVLRDHISYQYVTEFIGEDNRIRETADACFANEIQGKTNLRQRKNMIGFTPLQYRYPKAADAKAEQQKYKDTVIRFLDTLMAEDKELWVQFFPQLFNKSSDLGIIEEIRSKLRYKDRTLVFAPTETGIAQQKEIGKMKWMLATRYHSAVFACKMLVPCLCIAYEHKAYAMMDSFGLSECVLDINGLEYQDLIQKYHYIMENYERIYSQQKEKLSQITENAKKTVEWSRALFP